MAKTIYLSPSNHGVGQNKCLQKNCYEDKHTRPIANVCASYLTKSGFNVVVAKVTQTMQQRCTEANKKKADLYVPIHTNASSSKTARYVEFMTIRTNGKYRTAFDKIAPYFDNVYDGKVKHTQRTNLYEINVPNALSFYCELGFHTNEIDVSQYIHNPEIFGAALAKGICNYFGVPFKGGEVPTPVPTPTPKDVVVVDGSWGQGTTKYSQRFFKTTVDGIVSNQLNNCKKYLPNAYPNSWKFGLIPYGGSPMIKKLQAYIGTKVDGYFGKNSVKALQVFLQKLGLYTGAIDSIMGTGTVKAWQVFINKQFK